MGIGQDRSSKRREIVYLVDDDARVRDVLCHVLTSTGLCVEAFPSAEAFLERPFAYQPACLLLDIQLRGERSSLDVQAQLDQHPLPIVFMSRPSDIRASVRAMKAGAVDVLEKPLDDAVLIRTIDAALAVSRQRLLAHTERMRIVSRFEQLTRRERQLLWLVVRGGASNREIAAELGAAEKTVKVHRGRVMRKMQANSVADLVRMADRLPPYARNDEAVPHKRRIPA